VAAGVSVNQENSLHEVPAQIAAMWGACDALSTLLACGGNENVQDAAQRSLLALGAAHGHVDVVHALLGTPLQPPPVPEPEFIKGWPAQYLEVPPPVVGETDDPPSPAASSRSPQSRGRAASRASENPESPPSPTPLGKGKAALPCSLINATRDLHVKLQERFKEHQHAVETGKFRNGGQQANQIDGADGSSEAEARLRSDVEDAEVVGSDPEDEVEASLIGGFAASSASAATLTSALAARGPGTGNNSLASTWNFGGSRRRRSSFSNKGGSSPAKGGGLDSPLRWESQDDNSPSDGGKPSMASIMDEAEKLLKICGVAPKPPPASNSNATSLNNTSTTLFKDLGASGRLGSAGTSGTGAGGLGVEAESDEDHRRGASKGSVADKRSAGGKGGGLGGVPGGQGGVSGGIKMSSVAKLGLRARAKRAAKAGDRKLPETWGASWLTKPDKAGDEPLVVAAARGFREVVQALLNYRATTEAKDSRGNTPLLLAIARGDIVMVEDLLAAGAHRNVRNNRKVGVLEIPTSDRVKWLLEACATDDRVATAVQKSRAARKSLYGNSSLQQVTFCRVRLEGLPLLVAIEDMENMASSLLRQTLRGAMMPWRIVIATCPITARARGYAYADFLEMEDARELERRRRDCRMGPRRIHIIKEGWRSEAVAKEDSGEAAAAASSDGEN